MQSRLVSFDVHVSVLFQHYQTIDFLFSRLKTDARRKREGIEEKKFDLNAKAFCGQACSTDLIGHIYRTSEP